MMNEQSSPVVYGLFYLPEEQDYTLLGLYSLEGEAEAAREAYIAQEVVDLKTGQWQEIKHLQRVTVIRRLPLGQVPARRFAL